MPPGHSNGGDWFLFISTCFPLTFIFILYSFHCTFLSLYWGDRYKTWFFPPRSSVGWGRYSPEQNVIQQYGKSLSEAWDRSWNNQESSTFSIPPVSLLFIYPLFKMVRAKCRAGHCPVGLRELSLGWTDRQPMFCSYPHSVASWASGRVSEQN